MACLNKTATQLKEDWERAASSENYRNSIAQGFLREKSFKRIGESQTKAILGFLGKYDISIDNKRVVEIGCGAGRITEFLAKKAEFIYATDISMGMLKRFRERLGDIPNVALICSGDFSVIPDSSADIILSFLVFQHIPEILVKALLKDSIRVLKPGGHLVFQLSTKDKHEVVKSKSGATDMVRWTIEELEKIIKKTKYKVVSPMTSWLKIWRKPNET